MWDSSGTNIRQQLIYSTLGKLDSVVDIRPQKCEDVLILHPLWSVSAFQHMNKYNPPFAF